MSSSEVSGANLETKTIFIAGATDSGLFPPYVACAEVFVGKGVLAEVGLVSFLLTEESDKQALLARLAETLRFTTF